MNEHALEVLEYQKIINILASYASSEPGRLKIKQLSPISDIKKIQTLIDETSELKELLSNYHHFPLTELYDLSIIFDKVKDWNELLSVEDIAKVSTTIKTAKQVKEIINHHQQYSNLNNIVENIDDYLDLEVTIDNIIDQSGSIKDNASSRLKSLRKSMQIKKRKVQEKIQVLMKSSDTGIYLQDDHIRENQNRPTLAIMASYASKFKGERRGRSDSGKTVFIEPDSVRQLGDELEKILYDEKLEVQRLLGTLTEAILKRAQPLLKTVKILVHLDITYAKVCFSRQFHLNPPKLNCQGIIHIKKAIHPLLWNPESKSLSVEPRPIDVQLGLDFCTLIITGPNTGGKTVALKTIGLLTLMAQSGMHISAAETSNLAIFENIYADIGDEQSIEQSLSTFSSHLTNIKTILDEADEQSLVLLDELGGGTDPMEGEALAESILRYLHSKKVRTVVTTHISQLKNLAYTVNGFENASIEFDLKTLSPTYRLLLGVPGTSNALSLAKRLGLKEQVIKNAEKRTGSDETAVLLNHLQSVHASLTKKEASITTSKEHIENLEKNILIKHNKVQGQLDLAKKQSGEHSSELLRKIEQKVTELLSLEPSKKQLLIALRELKEAMCPKNKVSPSVDFKIDDQVRIKNLNKTGRIISLNRMQDSAIVMVGSLQLTVNKDDLTKLK